MCPIRQTLVEDARRAAVGLHAAGIDAYGVVLGQAGASAASRIFGRGKTMMVHRVEDLPNRLSELYFRLARLLAVSGLQPICVNVSS